MKSKLYKAIASLLQARINCEKSGNWVWLENHTESIEKIVKDNMPSGSGFDSGTTLDIDQSMPEKLVFKTSFHHMDEHGGYDGWTAHKVTIKASLLFGICVTVSGRDKNGIKEYIAEQFQNLADIEV